jgi:hypothetical protein
VKVALTVLAVGAFGLRLSGWRPAGLALLAVDLVAAVTAAPRAAFLAAALLLVGAEGLAGAGRPGGASPAGGALVALAPALAGIPVGALLAGAVGAFVGFFAGAAAGGAASACAAGGGAAVAARRAVAAVAASGGALWLVAHLL